MPSTPGPSRGAARASEAPAPGDHAALRRRHERDALFAALAKPRPVPNADADRDDADPSEQHGDVALALRLVDEPLVHSIRRCLVRFVELAARAHVEDDARDRRRDANADQRITEDVLVERLALGR